MIIVLAPILVLKGPRSLFSDVLVPCPPDVAVVWDRIGVEEAEAGVVANVSFLHDDAAAFAACAAAVAAVVARRCQRQSLEVMHTRRLRGELVRGASYPSNAILNMS